MVNNNLSKSHVLVATILIILIQPSNVYCQDLIKNIQLRDTLSIVRKIDNAHYLVYNHGKDNRFCMVDNYNSYVVSEKLEKDNMIILDFEIFDDYVYFCGIDDTISPNSVFGYFKLSNFPYATVYYDVRNEWEAFNKLDAFKVEDQRHIVMTATYHNGYGTMMDVRENPSGGWIYCDADFEEYMFRFFDVAVIDEYVVFSSIGDFDNVMTKTDANLWYIKKPTGSGIPIFNNVPNNMYRLTIFVSVFGEMLIEHIIGNEFAVVHKSGSKTDFDVSYLDGMNYIKTTIISCDAGSVLKDIKKSGIIGEVIVLVNNTSILQALQKSVLYSIPYNAPGPYVMVFRKYSPNELINSIDWISWHAYVGSGHNPSGTDLHVYLSNLLQSGNCFNDFGEKEYVKEYEYISPEILFPHRSFPYTIDTIDYDTATIKTNIICE